MIFSLENCIVSQSPSEGKPTNAQMDGLGSDSKYGGFGDAQPVFTCFETARPELNARRQRVTLSLRTALHLPLRLNSVCLKYTTSVRACGCFFVFFFLRGKKKCLGSDLM